jgi:hypothetical protein
MVTMSARNLWAWGLTAFSLCAGLVVSLKTADWTWFSRSGAAVVAVGIVLTSRQVFEHNRRLLAHQRRRQAGGVAGVYGGRGRDWADQDSIRQLIRSRSREEDSWRSEFSGFHMLVGGTLVWGFGDLIGLAVS